MKKSKTILALGLCVALACAGGGLVACQKDKDPGPSYTAGENSPYWLAGKIKGVDAWDPPTDTDGNVGEPADAVRFKYTEEADIYTVTLDLWQDDQFKIRYVGKGWDDEGGQLNASNNFDEVLNGDTENGISGEPGTGMGGRNFQVFGEGNYTVTINATGDVPNVTWVRNGDATDKAPIKVSGITVKNGETAITSLTLRMGETAQLTAEVLPENATDKTVEWKVTPAAANLFTCVDGLVTPKKEGTGKLQVKAGGKTVDITVTVVAAGAEIVDVESVTIPQAEKAITKRYGEKITVNPEVLPADATDKTVTYSVPKDSDVVTIENGVITAAKPGTVTVTATAGEKSDTFTVTVGNEFCLAGASASPAFGGNAWTDKYATAAAIPEGIHFVQDENDPTVYTLDVDLYAGNEFKVVSPIYGWSSVTAWGEGGYLVGAAEVFGLVNTATVDTVIPSSNAGSSKNIKVTNDGKYRFTLTIPATGAVKLEYKYLEEVAPLALNLDILVKGSFAEAWGVNVLCAEEVNVDNEWTAEFTLKVAENIEFGLFTAVHGTETQLKFHSEGSPSLTGCEGVTATSNFKCVTAGIYKFTVVLNEDGSFKSVTVVASDAVSPDADTTVAA